MRRCGHRRRRLAAWAAVAAVFALFVQALVPAAALAADSLGVTRIELCTDEGARSVVIGADGKVRKGFAGLPCHDCLSASLAMVAPPELGVAPVAYVLAPAAGPAASQTPRPRARAPPRPPGQGPPLQAA